MSKRGKKVSFRALIILVATLPMVVAIVILSFSNINRMSNELKNGIYEKLEVSALSQAKYFEQVLKEKGTVEEGSECGYIDSLKDSGIELTVFKEDVRVTTSIMADNGVDRNIGTKSSEGIWDEVSKGNKVEKDGVKIANGKYYVSYVPLHDADGKVWGMSFAGASQEKMDKVISQTISVNVILAVIVAVIFIIISVLFASIIKKSISNLVQYINRLSNGKIKQKEEVQSFIKEIDVIMESIESLRESLFKIIEGVTDVAENITVSVDYVDQLSDSNADGSNQIAQAVGELANTAQSLAESVQDTSNQTIVMGENIEDISQNVAVLSKSSEAIKAANDEAMVCMNTVMKSSSESVETVQLISKQIEDTNQAVDKINDCVSMIMEITSQTKLLALNASIEAARAGDAGRGFAVVATEIGNLATQSSDSAERITNLVKDVLEASAESVKGSETIKDAIIKEQQYVKETQAKFDVLSKEVEASLVEIRQIHTKTESLNKIKTQITNNITDLSAISEENGASAEEVSASCTTINEGIMNTKENTDNMKTLSGELRDYMAFFS